MKTPWWTGKNVRKAGLFCLVLLVVLGLAIRAQVTMGTLPIGFDVTVAYLHVLTDHQALSLLGSLRTFSLFYYVIQKVYSFTGIDALLFLKITGIVLTLSLTTTFYLVANRLLTSRYWLPGVATLLFALELGTLRLTWDLYRNIFSLTFCLIAFWQLLSLHSLRRQGWYAIPLTILWVLLAVASHQIGGFFILAVLGLVAVYYLVRHVLGEQSRLQKLLPVIICGMFLVLSRFIHYQGFSLWEDGRVEPPILVWEFFWLLYASLIPFVLVGMVRLRSKPLLLVTIFLVLITFSPVYLRGSHAYLWDRWMYFLVLPLTLYAAAGFAVVIEHLSFLAAPLRIASALLLLYLLMVPGLRFLNPAEDLPARYGSYDQAIFSHIPPSYLWNAVGREDARDLIQSAQALTKVYDGSAPIYTAIQYWGLFPYYLPGLTEHMVVVDPNTYPAWTPPATNRYYLFGINYARVTPGEPIPGASDRQPVSFYSGSTHP